MAAEMENPGSTQELAQFWKEVPKAKIMEHRYKYCNHTKVFSELRNLKTFHVPHRLRCHVLQSVKTTVSPLRDSLVESGSSGQLDLETMVRNRYFLSCLIEAAAAVSVGLQFLCKAKLPALRLTRLSDSFA